ncbi:MAG: Hvo_1808 family surface protein, partial [Halobacteriota archaeon]
PIESVDAQPIESVDQRAQIASTHPISQLTEEPEEDEGETAEPVGCVDGVCHNESIDVDQTEGLSDEELELFVTRSMARVEYIRGEPFNESVPVSVMTREEYREWTREAGEEDEETRAFNRWNDQVWKGLMIVGEDSVSEDEIDDTLGSAVAGFYSPARSEIVIITPDVDRPVIDSSTLIHELTHALQDQRHDLTDPRYQGETQDGDLAINGIVEGEAVYIERRYEERCESGEWECVGTPETGENGGDDGDLNLGIYVTVFHPYSDGPGMVYDIVEADGWAGVTERMEDPPVSTTQVIHRTDREPRPIEFTDEATAGWETYPNQGVDGADTVGEASIYAMFYYQSREYGADAIDWRQIGDADHPYEQLNYVSEPSAGWANDELYPYRRGDDENGYVWVTEWETERDATEFYDAYNRILDAHTDGVRDSEERADGIAVIDDGGFAGAYGVLQNDTTVTIVHGPTPQSIEALRPGVADALEADSQTPSTETEPSYPTVGDETTVDVTTEPGTETPVPGFGIVATVLALAIGTRIARTRR